MIDITLAPRIYASYGPFVVTDANIGALIVSAILVLLVAFGSTQFALVPTRLQIIVEAAVDIVYSRLRNAFGNDRDARNFLPLFVLFFFFIFIANQLTLLPFLFDIVWGGGALVRQPTTDFSGTITMALIVVVVANVFALAASPWGHIRTFIQIDKFLQVRSFQSFFQACIDFAIGLLNILGEFSKILSLSARLFGNVFAGNVIVLVLAGLSTVTGYFVPIPFIALSIFSGIVQAYVFTALSMEFTLGSVVGARQYAESVKK